MEKKINFYTLSFLEFNDLMLYFFKYCLPRHTYMKGVCIKIFKNNYEVLNKKTKETVIKDIENRFPLDDKDLKDLTLYIDKNDWYELKDFLIDKINTEVKEKNIIESEDIDLIFVSALRYFLFYGNENKEIIYDYFFKTYKLLPDKTLIIMENDLKRELMNNFLISNQKIKEEDKLFWKNFYDQVLKIVNKRGLEIWN